MPPKRPRRASPVAQGLSAGERLKRAKLSGNDYTAWGWVGSEVTNPTQITLRHRRATCGFSDSSPYPLCPNKYAVASDTKVISQTNKGERPKVEGELEDDVIVISDDELPLCTSKGCKSNPNCLNYLGQDKWENEDKARSAFMKASGLDSDPSLDTRSLDTPMGLKNLGATCYANAYLQVWYQDLPFRAAVYNCRPSEEDQEKFEDSPVFQLQVTFAAMQMCQELAFNPIKLVESLKLRTTEQQDAQEFSKLFMAHLDSEFQKQSDPTLQSLIANQFQGKQVYATVCTQCHNRSERESEFLEIEVNIANNAKLEDRVAALLQPEELDGDNKYLCSVCNSLQKAKRYTELRELPPVLHFSLLRFVYDLNTMERKKSKQAIAFPKTLDMDGFIKGSTSHNRYQLRGVLLHKGPSAYHGHYEAQIFDVKTASWYQFNDEVVTKIASLGPHLKVASKANGGSTKQAKSIVKPKPVVQTKKHDAKADSDIEIIDDATPTKPITLVEDKNYILSRDAYMLVYVRSPSKASTSEHMNNHHSKRSAETTTEPTPPLRALNVVEDLNNTQDQLCSDYDAKKAEAGARFDEIRRTVMDIYQTWSLSRNSDEDYVISKGALESWLSRHLAEKEEETLDSMDIDDSMTVIPNEDIQCVHGKLDPNKAAHMKRVKKTAVDRIASEDGCNFAPLLGSSDVCEQCVEGQFTERLYQIEHPRLVSLFDEVSAVDENEPAYWISTKWLKDWRSAKPRMHKASQTDPPPDDPEYDSQVRCEHESLTSNALSRKRISSQGYELLRTVFPNWTTLTTDAEICAACEALVHISREDRREAKIQAEEEKAKLKHMYDNALTGGTSLLEHVPCAIVSAQFVRAWKQWLLHPGEVRRPESIDNSEFICQHGRLVIDPNSPSDLDASVVIITRKDWETLEALYFSGPLIALENDGSEWTHDHTVCQECRLDRKTAFDVTELTIRLLRPEDPIPTPETYCKDVPPRQKPYQTTLLTYGSRTVGNLRQSKRLRQVGSFGKRKRVTVTRATTIRDLKVKIQEQFDIPTIYQCLYYQGRELGDNTATIGSLNVLANDVMDLREDSEDIDLLGSDEERPAHKSDEGQGFGGTLLVSGAHLSSHSHTPSDHDEPMAEITRACPACTFENSPDVVCCAMCETPLDPDTLL